MHESLNLVISNEVRDLAFPATYQKRISRLRLEMTIATQSLKGEDVSQFVVTVVLAFLRYVCHSQRCANAAN